jgi:hypothetical protein
VIKRLDKPTSRRLLKALTADRIALCISALLIVFVYRRFLFSPWASGWDTLPQLHLFFKMARLLKQGMVFGYDLEWFGGFPIFIFYGFLPYMLAAGLHVLSGGLIPMLWLAKLTVIGAPLLLLASVYTFVGVYFGKKYRLTGLIILQAFFFSPLNPHMGIGLSGAVHHGLFLNLFGASLILWCLSCLEKNSQTGKAVYFAAAVLLATAIAFSHVISSMAAGLIISTYFLSNARWKQWIAFSIWVLLLSFFYLYPYLHLDSYTNSTKMNSSYLMLYSLIGLNLPPRLSTIGIGDLLEIFPPAYVLILVCFAAGSIKLLQKRKWFLPLTMLLYVTLIPSNLMYDMFDLTMHYYRLHCYFFIIYLLIAIYGFEYFLSLIPPQKTLFRHMSHALLIALILPFVLSFRPRGEIVDWDGDYKNDRLVMQYIADQKPTGRVFIERSYALPNPHLFSVYLPMLYKIPVVFGLLIESADNSRFIVPPIRTVSENLVWGGTLYDMQDLSYQKILEKIGDLGIEYVVFNRLFSKETMGDYLRNTKAPVVEALTQIGDHWVFRKKNFLPLISRLKHGPILLINDHWNMSNRDVLTLLYRSRLNVDIKIAFWEKGAPWPPQDLLNQFETIIYIPPMQSDFARQKLESFKGKNVIYFVDGTVKVKKDFTEAPRLGAAEVYFATFNEPNGFFDLLEKQIRVSTSTVSVEPEFVSDTKIIFTAQGPTVVDIGYFPYWHAQDGSPLFHLSPSKLLVLANGRTTLEYKLPLTQKILMALSLVSLMGLGFWVWRETNGKKT